MQFELDESIQILERTPAVLRAQLGGLSGRWLTGKEGPDTWSPRDVLGHLIHCEQDDWIPRARILLEHGESRVFDPFDRFAFKQWVDEKSLGELLDEFETLRTHNIETLVGLGLNAGRLAKTGTHPEFGRVTLAELIATWAVHDLAHLYQIARVMAKQYDKAVGPWKEYLSLLQR